MRPHADYPTRLGSPLSRPAKPQRWHTWQPTIWVLRRTRSGRSALLRPPLRLGRLAFGNGSGSEKDSRRRFENWSSMTSEVEARSAGTYLTTDIGPFVALPLRSRPITAARPQTDRLACVRAGSRSAVWAPQGGDGQMQVPRTQHVSGCRECGAGSVLGTPVATTGRATKKENHHDDSADGPRGRS